VKASRALVLGLLLLPLVVVSCAAGALGHAQAREAREESSAKGRNSLGAGPQAPQTGQQTGSSLPAGTAVPRLVKFSATLKDHLGKLFGGTVGVTFSIYKDEEGGAALWLETQNVELDEQGHYTVLLGSSKSEGLPLELFTAGEPRWLGVQVNLPKETEQPRVLLVSVPYALKASDADTLGGKPASVYLTTEQGGVVGTTGKTNGSAGVASSAVSGTGSANVVPKWLDNVGTLGNSQISDDGTNVNMPGNVGALAYKFTGNAAAPTDATATILNQANVGPVFSGLSFRVRTGAPAPADALSIDPSQNVSITGNASALAYKFTGNAAAPTDATATILNQANVGPVFSGLSFRVRTGAGMPADALTVDPNQRVGIGTTTPSQKLEVAGIIKVSGAGNVQITGAGNGIVAKSPDGTQCKTIGIDNTGSLVVTPYVCPVSQFTTSTFQQGSLLVMQNQTSTDTVRIGLETAWGGSIVEVSLNGTNFVNEHDTGREVQPAFYDGNAKYDNCAGCTGVFGWDPVLGGDKYDHGTPTLAQTLTSTSLYTKAQSLQWNPDDKGGGPGQPVLGDVLVEQTVTPVAGHARAFQVHYKVTHLGNDLHTNATQEFPAVYVNADYNQFVYYGGNTPWTSGAVSITQFPVLPAVGPLLYVPEHWGAHVNAQNSGLTVYVPSQFPYVSGFDFPGPAGPTGNGTNYFAPLAALTFGPNFVVEGDMYLIAGDYPTARQIIYDLHQSVTASNIFTPIGNTDLPAGGTTISGATTVAGWTFGNVNVAKVEILVDGVVDGTGAYGSPRPDVATVYPNAPVNIGFSYSLATSKYANGSHILNVRATDTTGNVAVFPNVNVTVSN
jgi:hypothetical protein